MREVKDWEERDLDEIVAGSIKESSTLEYKDSRSLSKKDEVWIEMCKDVAAFANSDGGILVYGIQERDNKPVAVDGGVDPAVIKKEWIEDILHAHIVPKIDKLFIRPIDLTSKGTGFVAYVFEIGQATSRAPHQIADTKLYYKRFNFKAQALGDSEVRDLMRRGIEYGRKYGAALDLYVEINRISTASQARVKA